MFPYKVITNLDQAEEYRDNLNADEEEYLYKVDAFVAKIEIDEPVYLPREVKPSNIERFWLAFTYILFAINKDLAISDDLLTMRIVEPMPKREMFVIA